jgi:hypothetical protein
MYIPFSDCTKNEFMKIHSKFCDGIFEVKLDNYRQCNKCGSFCNNRVQESTFEGGLDRNLIL